LPTAVRHRPRAGAPHLELRRHASGRPPAGAPHTSRRTTFRLFAHRPGSRSSRASGKGVVPVTYPGRRVFAQRRAPHRRLFPDARGIVGGPVERGASLLGALARETEEETGRRLRRVVRLLDVSTWTGDDDGRLRREADFLVEVDGDLERPAPEWSGHTAYGWFGPGDLERLTENRAPGDCADPRPRRAGARGAPRRGVTAQAARTPGTGPPRPGRLSPSRRCAAPPAIHRPGRA
jgi:8-oxo-dGTP diphosphatase